MPENTPDFEKWIPYRHKQPAESPPELVVPNVMPIDERIWVPVEPNVWFRPLLMCTSRGYWCNLLRVRRSGVLSRHRHPLPVHGLTRAEGGVAILECDPVSPGIGNGLANGALRQNPRRLILHPRRAMFSPLHRSHRGASCRGFRRTSSPLPRSVWRNRRPSATARRWNWRRICTASARGGRWLARRVRTTQAGSHRVVPSE